MTAAPILMLGAGRMGGAMARGWLRAKAFAPADLAFRSRSLGDEARRAVVEGAAADPEDLSRYPTVVLAVKPQTWRAATADLAQRLAPGAVIVSVIAGVQHAEFAAAFGGRPVARVMPTTGVALADGVASVFAPDARARAVAHALFDPIATVVDLSDEALLDAATAVSGSMPAYLYAFVEALEAAGVEAGLSPDAAATLVRATAASAARLLKESGEDPADLRRQVTSPNGVTAAALQGLMDAERGFPHLMREAAAAAIRRSRDLGAPSA